MIKVAQTQFYRAHKDTLVEFCKGVNIITGSSDKGKSAFLQSLLWVLRNKPLGDEFVSWFANKSDITSVGIEFFDGSYISKYRKKNKNYYDINGEELEAVGSDIPDQLLKITQMAEYNIKTQHEPYFLIQDTPGQVARKFNEWVGLDIIDQTYSRINKIITASKGLVEENENKIKDLEDKIKQQAYLDKIQEKLNKTETLIIEQEKIEAHRSQLESTLKKLDVIDKEIHSISYDEKFEKEVMKIKTILLDWQNELKKIHYLQQALTSLDKIEAEIKEEIAWLEVEKIYKEVKTHIAEEKKQEEKNKKLFDCLIVIEETDKFLKEKEIEIDRLESKMKTKVASLEICHYCGQDLTVKSKKYIQEHLL